MVTRKRETVVNPSQGATFHQQLLCCHANSAARRCLSSQSRKQDCCSLKQTSNFLHNLSSFSLKLEIESAQMEAMEAEEGAGRWSLGYFFNQYYLREVVDRHGDRFGFFCPAKKTNRKIKLQKTNKKIHPFLPTLRFGSACRLVWFPQVETLLWYLIKTKHLKQACSKVFLFLQTLFLFQSLLTCHPENLQRCYMITSTMIVLFIQRNYCVHVLIIILQSAFHIPVFQLCEAEAQKTTLAWK